MKRLLMAIAMAVMIMSLGACGSSDTDEGAETPPTQSQEGTFLVSVNEISRTTEDEWDELGEDEELIVLDIDVTNNTDGNQDFNPNYVSLVIDHARVSTASAKEKGKSTISGLGIAPGEKIQGYIFYEVKKGAEIAEIRYDDFKDQYNIEF